MKTISKWFVKMIMCSDIKLIVLIISIIPMIFLAFAAYFSEQFFVGDVPIQYTVVVMTVALFIWSLAGIVQIIRRESPGIMGKNIHGKVAMWMGSLWVVFCWVIIFLSIYSLGEGVQSPIP